MQRNLVKVQGMYGWYKDLETGTVINTNTEEILIAKKRKQNSVIKQNEKNQMVDQISSMQDEMKELKELIKTLTENK